MLVSGEYLDVPERSRCWIAEYKIPIRTLGHGTLRKLDQ